MDPKDFITSGYPLLLVIIYKYKLLYIYHNSILIVVYSAYYREDIYEIYIYEDI